MPDGADAGGPQGRPRWVYALGRIVGFAVLAAPALVILAALALLPEYAAWKQEVYRRDCTAAATADLQSLKEAQERMVVAAYDDPVFIKRLAENMCNLWPTNEQVLESSLPPAPPPGVVIAQPHPRPAEPNDALIRLAARVSPGDSQALPARRGLLLVSLGLLLFAVLLFGPAPRRRAAPRTA